MKLKQDIAILVTPYCLSELVLYRKFVKTSNVAVFDDKGDFQY